MTATTLYSGSVQVARWGGVEWCGKGEVGNWGEREEPHVPPGTGGRNIRMGAGLDMCSIRSLKWGTSGALPTMVGSADNLIGVNLWPTPNPGEEVATP